MAKDLIGQTLGGYQITGQIGKGGMATIYKAFQPSLEREVAIKILPPYYAEQDESFIARFKREAKAIGNLQHQNILMVMDTGQDGDYFYIVMEYISAGTMKELIAERSLSLKEIANLITQLADALDYAHSKGVVHRDIKPSNILMRREDWALLTDFGLAKMMGGSMLTQSGMTVGTPAYMSPEQGSGAKIDARTDIYALGVMLYEMTVGEVPYMAETPMAVVVKHITEPLPMPRAKNPNLPEDVQRIILKALAKNPDDRYQSAGDMAKALSDAAMGMPDWTASEMPTVVSGGEAPQTTEPVTASAPTLAPTMVSPAETLAGDPMGSTQVSASGGQNIWKWAAIAMAAVAVILVGIFGTIAFLNWQADQSVTDTRDDTQNQLTLDQPTPENDSLPEDGNGLPGAGPGQQPGGFGNAPLPDAPPEDSLIYVEPWDEGFGLMKIGNYRQAHVAFYQALREQPELWGDFLDAVESFDREYGPGPAADILKFGLITRPDPSNELDQFIWLGYLEMDAGHPELAMQAFAYVMNQNPDDDVAFYGFYNAGGDVDRPAEVLRLLENMRERGIETPALFNVLGYLYEDAGDYERALQEQTRAVALNSQDPWLQLDLAVAYLNVEDYAQAEKTLEAALSVADNDPSVLESIGWVYLDLDRYDRATEAFQRSVEIMPENAWGALGLAGVYFDEGINLGEISGLLDQAYLHGREDAWLLLNVGWLYEDFDGCEKAVPLYEEALQLEPDLFEAEDALQYCASE